ncbi:MULTISPECIES: prepilin peptidase [unclassified Isoptericola]|uniref:prepilin peptidase n=1 Tax=unclassified Isoptericola TaxID=2623355 RepID=UPI00364F88B4
MRASTLRLVRESAMPTVVMVLALAAVAIAFVEDRWLSLALLGAAPAAAAAAVIDARYKRIPTPLVRATAAVGVVVFTVAAVATGEVSSVGRSLLASVVVGAGYLLLWRFAGLGLGDVRLAAALGLFAGWSGWPAVLAFVVLAHVAVLPLALWQLARRLRGDLPFAPSLVVGLYTAIALVG